MKTVKILVVDNQNDTGFNVYDDHDNFLEFGTMESGTDINFGPAQTEVDDFLLAAHVGSWRWLEIPETIDEEFGEEDHTEDEIEAERIAECMHIDDNMESIY